MDRRTELERRAEEFARRIGAPNVPMSAERKEQINEFARRIGAPNVPMSAAREEQLREFVRRINGGSWDSAKHPRGGNPQNRGEFSVAGGPGGAAEPSVARERGPGGPGDQTSERSPIYLAQKQKPEEKDELDRINKSLDAAIEREKKKTGAKDDAPAKKPGGVLGSRTWISSGGSKLEGTLESISKDGKSVTLKPSDGKKPVTVPVDKLSGHDQALIKGLQAMPRNVTLNPDNLEKENQQAWLELVVIDFGRLSELPNGKQVLDDIEKSNYGHHVTIKPRGADSDNKVEYVKKGRGSDAVVSYDPTATKGDVVQGGTGDRERPPFIALGKELWTGQRALIGKAFAERMPEEISAAEFENDLRDEYNKNLKPGDKPLPYRAVPQ